MPFICDVPAAPTLLVEDDKVKVTRWDFPPGAATGWHEHGMDYVVVVLLDGVMEYEVDGVVARNEVKAGQSYARPKGVKHDVRNAGDAHFAFVEIEMKR